jgi:murein L,D-transpeptidase YcbB/YkuD
VRFALALTVLLAAAPPLAAQEDPPDEVELLRARVESLVTDADARVFGVRIASRRALPALYQHRGFRRAFPSAERSDALLRAIRDSARDGLDPADYLLPELERARAEVAAEGAGLETALDYDVLQTEALIRLLYHLIFGKVDPQDSDPHWNFTRQVRDVDPGAFIDELLESGELYERIEARKPRYELYQRLRAELARQREIAARGGWGALPEGPKLEPGAAGPRVAALRARLQASADLAPDAPPTDPERFDAALADALRRFQARHGLEPDAVVGPATLAALDTPVEARIEQIRVNLERGRWYLHDLDPTFVVVNVAGFEVHYLRDAKLVWSARAIIGKPFRATPIFRSRMTYLVLNPTWTVPPGILANDILPAQRRNPSYLAKKGLQVVDRNGRVVPSASIDWSKATGRSFPYRLVQPPGPDNALGRVKFMFPNSYSVYLHDTPSRNLFERSERAFSSGCIRIENPLELAALLLEGQSGWDRAALDAAIAAGKTRTVTLERPVPVLLTYFTAWVNRDGVLQLRGDVYGRDPKVLRGLDAEFRYRGG